LYEPLRQLCGGILIRLRSSGGRSGRGCLHLVSKSHVQVLRHLYVLARLSCLFSALLALLDDVAVCLAADGAFESGGFGGKAAANIIRAV
jgi:hypothetical protein